MGIRRDHKDVVARAAEKGVLLPGGEELGTPIDIGVKHDQGKTRFDLLPAEALYELAGVYTAGAAKYDDRNWEKGIMFGRVFAAIMRHAWKWWMGEEVDEEDGFHHMAHAAWGCLALVHYSRKGGMDYFDDRPIVKKGAVN